MKKYSVLIMSAVLLASSCTTGAGAGAYAGSSLGSVFGSAIGGIIGGPRGSDIGTIVGMASGAAMGAAVGSAADRQQNEEQSEVLARRNQRIQREKAQRGYTTDSQYGDDTYGYRQHDGGTANIDPSQMVDSTNSGDDRIDFGTGSQAELIAQTGTKNDGKLTVKNVRFADENADGKLSGNETAKVTFEIFNDNDTPIYGFDPTVAEADGNKRIYISPSVHVEDIMPGQGLRYTATVKADRRIKDGQIRLFVSAQKDGKPISYVTVLKVETVKLR